MPRVAYQKSGRKYYRYGNFTDVETAVNTAWKLKRKNRKVRYKVTPERIGGKVLYTLWLSNYMKW